MNGLKCGGEQTLRVVVTQATWEKVAPKITPKADVRPEGIYEDLNLLELDPTQEITSDQINCDTQLVSVKDGVDLPVITAFRLLALKQRRWCAPRPAWHRTMRQGVRRSGRRCRRPRGW